MVSFRILLCPMYNSLQIAAAVHCTEIRVREVFEGNVYSSDWCDIGGTHYILSQDLDAMVW
jgi:hypothetical protein